MNIRNRIKQLERKKNPDQIPPLIVFQSNPDGGELHEDDVKQLPGESDRDWIKRYEGATGGRVLLFSRGH